MIKTNKRQQMDKTGHRSCKSADTQEDMSPCSASPITGHCRGCGAEEVMIVGRIRCYHWVSQLRRDSGHNADRLRPITATGDTTRGVQLKPGAQNLTVASLNKIFDQEKKPFVVKLLNSVKSSKQEEDDI